MGWLQNRMFDANIHGDLEHAKTLVIVGKNPWQSNGFQRARILMREFSKDPERTLIVIDPKRTESADLADIHLPVRSGRDAWVLSAMLAHIIQDDLVPHEWIAEHTVGFDKVRARFQDIPIEAYAAFAGVDLADVQAAAVAIAQSGATALYEDIGMQMAPNSTLASYLNMLLVLTTGNFGERGTMSIITGLPGPMFNKAGQGKVDEEGYETGWKTSPVTNSRIVSALVPCNDVPAAILTDHPDRYRAMFVESGNPAHSMADSHKWREALRKLDLVVVMDIAMTETVTHGTVGGSPHANAPMSLGRPATGYEIFVLDGEGHPVAPGEVGDLFVRGVRGISLFLEYAGDPEATAAAFRPDGLFITGDRVRLGNDGCLYFVDRSKDMLKVGGENVAASEIEGVIAAAEGVAEAAVVSMPHPMLDEVPAAFVLQVDGCRGGLLDRITAACCAGLAEFKLPKLVRIVDTLPRATLEKVAKAELRAQLIAELASATDPHIS